MPVSLIQATAEEAADNFRQEIGAVLSGLASALGTPYPSTIVTDEADGVLSNANGPNVSW